MVVTRRGPADRSIGMNDDLKLVRILYRVLKSAVSLIEEEFGFTPWRSDVEWAKKVGWKK